MYRQPDGTTRDEHRPYFLPKPIFMNLPPSSHSGLAYWSSTENQLTSVGREAVTRMVRIVKDVSSRTE